MNPHDRTPEGGLLPAFLIIVCILAAALFWFGAVRENDERLWTVKDCADQNCTADCTGDEWRAAFEWCERRVR